MSANDSDSAAKNQPTFHLLPPDPFSGTARIDSAWVLGHPRSRLESPRLAPAAPVIGMRRNSLSVAVTPALVSIEHRPYCPQTEPVSPAPNPSTSGTGTFGPTKTGLPIRHIPLSSIRFKEGNYPQCSIVGWGSRSWLERSPSQSSTASPRH